MLFYNKFSFPTSHFIEPKNNRNFHCHLGRDSCVNNENSCSSNPDPSHSIKESHLENTSRTSAQMQYLSATCVVITNYAGDTANVVDEHFSRALNHSNKDNKGKYFFFCHVIYFKNTSPTDKNRRNKIKTKFYDFWFIFMVSIAITRTVYFSFVL